MTRPSGRPTNQPGAVPFGLGNETADPISQACLRLSSGKGMSRRRHSSRSHASRSGSSSGVSSHTAAIASRVRSSGVGPRPPVEMTRSDRSSAAAKASVTATRSSGSAVSRVTRTPRPVSERAISPAFVSRVSPTVSSLPMLSSSAVRSRRETASDMSGSVARRVAGDRPVAMRCYHRH